MEENKATEATDQNNSGKEQKNYEKNMQKLAAILGGKENIFPTKKVSNDAITGIVGDLLKERKEKLVADVKTGLQEVLDKKVVLDKTFKEEEEKLKKLKEQKQKEFNEACTKIFSKIEGIDELERNYLATLSAATPTDTTTNTNN